MLRRAFRNSISKSVQQQGRWIKYVEGGNAKQPGVVDQEPHALGDYYKYIYANNVDPELFLGLNKPYPNAYEAAPLYEWDNWIFEYHGQWWDHGSPFANGFLLIYPLLLFVMVYFDQVSITFCIVNNLFRKKKCREDAQMYLKQEEINSM